MKLLINWYLGYIVPGFVLLPLIAGLISYKKIGRPLKALLLYMALTIVGNVSAIVLIYLYHNNMPALHAYTALETVTLLFYYRRAFGPGKTSNWLAWLMVAFPVLCVINVLFFQSIFSFNTYTRPLGALIIIVVTGIYLGTQSTFKNQRLITASGRIVASGLLIYCCSSLFLFIFSDVLHIKASRVLIDVIYTLHATFDLIMFLFFFAAILNERNKR